MLKLAGTVQKRIDQARKINDATGRRVPDNCLADDDLHEW